MDVNMIVEGALAFIGFFGTIFLFVSNNPFSRWYIRGLKKEYGEQPSNREEKQ